MVFKEEIINNVMQINLGDKTLTGDIPKRYYVHYLPHTTDHDKTQLWTWLKYEFPRMDINPQQRVFGANVKDFSKIDREWSAKFKFE